MNIYEHDMYCFYIAFIMSYHVLSCFIIIFPLLAITLGSHMPRDQAWLAAGQAISGHEQLQALQRENAEMDSHLDYGIPSNIMVISPLIIHVKSISHDIPMIPLLLVVRMKS